MGLAQQPDGENWRILVQAVSALDDAVAREVFNSLATVDRRPEQPEPLRQVILAGLRSPEKVGPVAVRLLSHWTGEQLGQADDSPAVTLSAWQKWFAKKHPNHPPAELPVDSPKSEWTYQELLKYLESDDGSQGDVASGAVVFAQAECIKCHRYGDAGERIGPDLTTIGMRFQQKEILESILFPSQVISDQYTSQKLLTTDGRVLEGIVAQAGPNSLFVLQQDGEKVEVLLSDVEEQAASRQSSMPAGLLDKLTLKQIADLFAFMRHRPRTATTNRRGAIGR
jgi:putative heme-binding domain-containing protein